MSDQPSTEPEQHREGHGGPGDSDTAPETPQGPLDPARSGGPGVQPPPGSPMRTDSPDGPFTPADPVRDPGPHVHRVTRDEHPDPPPVRGTVPTQSDAERARQEENAATSDDEPSI